MSQNGKPIAFMRVTKQSWSTYAREMLAIVIVVRTWRPYIIGRTFTIQTDQQSLCHLLEQRILTPEKQKWMGNLISYDCQITYKPGRTNSASDALSWVHSSPTLDAILCHSPRCGMRLKHLTERTHICSELGLSPQLNRDIHMSGKMASSTTITESWCHRLPRSLSNC